MGYHVCDFLLKGLRGQAEKTQRMSLLLSCSNGRAKPGTVDLQGQTQGRQLLPATKGPSPVPGLVFSDSERHIHDYTALAHKWSALGL